MATNESRADLLDPGDRMETDNCGLTDSQLKDFDERDFLAEDPISASNHLGSAGGRKRKGSSSDHGTTSVGGKRHLADATVASLSRSSSAVAHEVTSTPPAKRDELVVLVRPADESSKKMLLSPERLCASLEAAPFANIKITDVRVNPRKGLVAIELAPESATFLPELLLLTKLGPWSVVCSRPNGGRFSYGVITSIDVEADLEAMATRVRVDGAVSFVKLDRLTRMVDGRKVPSTSLRITFEGTTLPRTVKIGYISYPVRQYEFPPLQCYKCQRFGHSADGCNSKVRCLLCSGPHHFNDCQNDEVKCANCGGPHKANSKDCERAPRRAEPKRPGSLRVSTVRAWGSGAPVSHSSRSSSRVDAPRSIHHASGSGQGARSREMSANANSCVCRPAVSPVVSSYRSAVVGQAPAASCHDFVGFSPVSLSDSVRCSSSAAVPPAEPSAFFDVAFLSRLSACLTDLFSLSLHKESSAKVQSLVASAVQKHFDVTLPVSTVASVVAQSVSSESMALSLPDPHSSQSPCPSPSADTVCSAGEDLATCLGVDKFSLVPVSDDDSLDMTSVVGGRECSSGVQDGSPVSKTLEPTPSPVLGNASLCRPGRPKKILSVKTPLNGAPSSSSRAAASSSRVATRSNLPPKPRK